MNLRMSPQTILVLDAFLVQADDWKYGYDLSRITGLKSGTLYPILMRMAERGLLETQWETGEPGKPPGTCTGLRRMACDSPEPT